MPLDFTAIDFETANEERGSVCAVGLARVRDGIITRADAWLVYPPTGDRFTNTSIHRIRPADVAEAHDWPRIAARVDAIADGSPLVAYNARFDRGVFDAACHLAELHPAPYRWFDALQLARTHLSLPAYKLPTVAQHLGLTPFDHHDPRQDAVACAQIVLELAAATGRDACDDLWPDQPPAPRRRPPRAAAGPLPTTNPAADPRHPLFGESITFSGDLETLSRDEARAAAANAGAKVTAGPTKTTTVLVVGGFDPATLRPGAAVSSKVQKVLDLQAAGRDIRILTEPEFIALLAAAPV